MRLDDWCALLYKDSTRNIVCLDEERFVDRLSRRILKYTSFRRTMHLVPVFILEDALCVQLHYPSSSIKTANIYGTVNKKLLVILNPM